MCRSTKFALQSAAAALLAAPKPGFKVCQLSCHGADPGKVQPGFRGQWLEPRWPHGPAVWHTQDKQLQIAKCNPQKLPIPFSGVSGFIREGTFWKESLKCLKITCCIMEWPQQTPLEEQARRMMHVGNSTHVPSPSSWDVFKWGKMNS